MTRTELINMIEVESHDAFYLEGISNNKERLHKIPQMLAFIDNCLDYLKKPLREALQHFFTEDDQTYILYSNYLWHMIEEEMDSKEVDALWTNHVHAYIICLRILTEIYTQQEEV